MGRRLINFGLEQLRSRGIKLVFTYGDPNYYSQVGFQQISEDTVKAPLPLSQPEGWLCQTLDGSDIKPLQDKPCCVDALQNPEYW